MIDIMMALILMLIWQSGDFINFAMGVGVIFLILRLDFIIEREILRIKLSLMKDIIGVVE